jgi:hypothetical protein
MRASVLSLCTALTIVLLLSSHEAAAQSGGPPSAVGADQIRAVLIEHPEWTVYWSSLGAAPRPPTSAGTGTVRFTRHGDTIMAHIEIPAMARKCERLRFPSGRAASATPGVLAHRIASYAPPTERSCSIRTIETIRSKEPGLLLGIGFSQSKTRSRRHPTVLRGVGFLPPPPSAS